MKTLPRAIGIMLLILGATLVNHSAMAQHRGHKHGHGHGHGHGPILRVGFSYGFPIHAPHYFFAPFYTFPGYAFPAPIYSYSPAVIRYSPSPVYVERSIAPAESAPPQAQNDWYYCASSRTYYPYATECPGGWQRVPAQTSSR